MRALVFLWALAACEPAPILPPKGGGTPAQAPSDPSAAITRLTQAQWRASVHQLLGVDFSGYLPADYVLHGHASVGAASLSTGPFEGELYEAAAWEAATQALPDEVDLSQALGCDAAVAACVRAWTVRLAEGAWRRSPASSEIAALTSLHDEVAGAMDERTALRAVVAALLASPHFLYRVETGVPDPEAPGRWRYTGDELAARLSLLLTNRGPDELLRKAAREGVLDTPEGVQAEASRLLDTPEARASVATFWSEVFDLYRLQGVSKDGFWFRNFAMSLREAMVDEALWLLLDVTMDRDVDVREVFTSTATKVTPELAALYGMSGIEQTTVANVPEHRGGLLGRGAVAAIHAHPIETSPTRRGRFIRTRLLCGDVPPPPPGVIAALEELESGVPVRERLAAHATNPSCKGCHDAMDPLGFGMENLNTIGQWQTHTFGEAIDATGEVDGIPFDGVAALGRAVAEHPDLPGCLALDLWRHLTGQSETVEQLEGIELFGDRLAADGWHWKGMLLDILGSDAFRRPAAQPDARPAEWCNGQDDDGDGTVDDLFTACTVDDQPGTSACVAGTWQPCVPVGGAH